MLRVMSALAATSFAERLSESLDLDFQGDYHVREDALAERQWRPTGPLVVPRIVPWSERTL